MKVQLNRLVKCVPITIEFHLVAPAADDVVDHDDESAVVQMPSMTLMRRSS